MLQGWVQTWYSDCQEQLEALNKQIYDLWQHDESAYQETGPDIPAEAPVSHTDIKRLLECKELLLTQAEGKLRQLMCLLCQVFSHLL